MSSLVANSNNAIFQFRLNHYTLTVTAVAIPAQITLKHLLREIRFM
jgi:hypothetical protein